MRNNSIISRRNKLIYEKYAELWGKGLREELIWPELVLTFHLEKNTVYRIVLQQSKMMETTLAEEPLLNVKDKAHEEKHS